MGWERSVESIVTWYAYILGAHKPRTHKVLGTQSVGHHGWLSWGDEAQIVREGRKQSMVKTFDGVPSPCQTALNALCDLTPVSGPALWQEPGRPMGMNPNPPGPHKCRLTHANSSALCQEGFYLPLCIAFRRLPINCPTPGHYTITQTCLMLI